jgi:8-oxo-dGTP diphosphatase
MADRSFTPQRFVGPVAGPVSARHRRGAKALVRTGGRVLLVRERHADGSPFWTLPGGGVEPNESLRGGLQRELVEELGCDSVVADAWGSFQYAHRSKPGVVSTYTIYETWLLDEPTPNGREGVTGYDWVDPQEPPAETLPQVVSVLAESNAESY